MSDLKKKILRKCSKPGFENLVLIYFKFQLLSVFLDYCVMMALDIRPIRTIKLTTVLP